VVVFPPVPPGNQTLRPEERFPTLVPISRSAQPGTLLCPTRRPGGITRHAPFRWLTISPPASPAEPCLKERLRGIWLRLGS